MIVLGLEKGDGVCSDVPISNLHESLGLSPEMFLGLIYFCSHRT